MSSDNEEYARELLIWIADSKEFDLIHNDVEELIEDFMLYKENCLTDDINKLIIWKN